VVRAIGVIAELDHGDARPVFFRGILRQAEPL
jgi:hypothetical protein